MARWTLILGTALAMSLCACVAYADEMGGDDVVIAGLDTSTLDAKCRVKILTKDGDEWKKTRVWNAVSDKRLYVLSSKSSWYKRAQDDAAVVLRVDDDDYPLWAKAIDDEDTRAAVHDELKSKCGWRYRLRSFFTFWRSNKVAQLVPRPRGR